MPNIKMLNSFLYSSVTLMQLSQLMNLIYLELLTAMRGGCFSAFVLNVLCQFRKQGDNVIACLWWWQNWCLYSTPAWREAGTGVQWLTLQLQTLRIWLLNSNATAPFFVRDARNAWYSHCRAARVSIHNILFYSVLAAEKWQKEC